MICRRLLVCTLTICSLTLQVHAAGSDEYKGIHSVGVISAIGDHLTITDIGATVFDNSQPELDISGWRLDELVRDQITTDVRKRFVAKPIIVDTSPLQKIDTGGLFDSSPSVREFVLSLPHRDDVDAYIVVCKTLIKDSSSSAGLFGLGIYHSNPQLLFHGATFAVYAYYQVVVIDSRTGKILDRRPARQ